MLTSLRLRCLAAASMVAMSFPAAANAQDENHEGHNHASPSIAYRLFNWHEMHFDDSKKASQHLAAVKKLNCEAKQESHEGHTDVIYRSPRWQSLQVATDELAHQWESWLKGAGFEIVHGHPEDHAGHDHAGHDHGPGGAEGVAYRLADWKKAHPEDEARHAELVALLQGLGCEVKGDQHDGHADVSFRCPDWTHAEFTSHRIAQGWEDWLKRNGFEVRHSH